MSYSTVDKLATIRVRCHKVLPAVYDESLSYLEQVCKLAYKVNETIESVNALNDNVDALNDAVTEFGTRLTTVEDEIDSFEEEMNDKFDTLEATINANVDSKLSEVDTAIGAIDSRLSNMQTELINFENVITNRVDSLETNLTNLINDELAYLNQMYSSLAVDLRNYIEVKVQEAISTIPDLTNIYVTDPTTGNTVKVQEAITNIFYYQLTEALTVDEYNAIGLTVNELNSLMVNSLPSGFSIITWLTKAKTLLVKQLDASRIDFLTYPHSIVRDYLGGDKVWHDRNVDINQMLIQIAGGYSCGELNTSNITFSDIQTANISCQEYALKANMLI